MNDFAMPDISWHHVSQDWKQEMCKWSKVTVPIEIALNKTFKKDQNEVQASPTEKVLAIAHCFSAIPMADHAE